MCVWAHVQGQNYVQEEGGYGPPNFFKILNNRYIFKILKNKSMKNYICPSQKNYICPPRLRILVLFLRMCVCVYVYLTCLKVKKIQWIGWKGNDIQYSSVAFDWTWKGNYLMKLSKYPDYGTCSCYSFFIFLKLVLKPN